MQLIWYNSCLIKAFYEKDFGILRTKKIFLEKSFDVKAECVSLNFTETSQLYFVQ